MDDPITKDGYAWGRVSNETLSKLESLIESPASALGAKDTDAADRECYARHASALGINQVVASLPDHAEATILALHRIIERLNAGTPPEDLGRDVELLGRIMARRT